MMMIVIMIMMQNEVKISNIFPQIAFTFTGPTENVQRYVGCDVTWVNLLR
jgi:hypothetical protein